MLNHSQPLVLLTGIIVVVVDVTDKEFEQMVADGIDALPASFVPYIENVAITWDYTPNLWQKMKLKLRPHSLLFGLYEGIPKTRRGANYSLVLPDKITIFKNPLCYVANDRQQLADMVKNTVWHEIAHHFGLSDHDIHQREHKRG